MPRSPRLFRVRIVIAAIALGGLPVAAQAPHTRDSSGIHIVENASRAKVPIGFTIGTTPTYDVGGIKDNPDDELDPHAGYRDAVRLADGGLALIDDSKIRFFDTHGKQTHVFGRPGEGPGEFRQMATICRTRGDTVVVYDPGNARATVFDRTGAMIRQLPIVHATIGSSACLADGTLLVVESDRATRQTKMSRLDLNGRVVANIGSMWGGAFGVFLVEYATQVANGNRVFLGDPRFSEVKIIDGSGKLIGIFRTADPVQKTTAAERNAMQPQVAPMMGSGKEAEDRYKEVLRTQPHPMEWPAFTRIAMSPNGWLWMEDYRRSRKDRDVWTGFDASGRMLGKISVPPDTIASDPRIIGFTDGGIMIRRQDADGADHLTIYPLLPAKRR